jgi:disulfide bond formation protein DsbB
MNLLRFIARWWTAFALLAALAMLGVAHAFETFGGLAPCPMCLKQRDAYWFAIAIALPATVWALLSRSKGTPRLASFLLFGVFAAGAAAAVFHAGGELHWWKLPPTCGGSLDAVSADDLIRAWAGATRVPACDVAAWKMWGLSMAGWNAIASALLAVFSLVASMRVKSDKGWHENVLR